MFQVKDFLSIVASMVNHVRGATKKLTDFNPGSVNRTMLEAAAIEIDELYQQMFNGLTEAIPTAIYQGFRFDMLPAVSAGTDIVFSAAPAPSAPIVIPAGTLVGIPNTNYQYATTADAQIIAGSTSVTARVVATQVGAAWNSAANTITDLINPISGVTSITNPNPVRSGRDVETPTQRDARFVEYIAALSRGPDDALIYGAKTANLRSANGDVTEYVSQAVLIKPYETDNTQPLGYVNLYVFNGAGSTSAALVSQCQNVINGYVDSAGKTTVGWKAAGCICRVMAVTEQVQNVTATLTALPGYTNAELIPLVQQVISDYLFNLGIGKTLLFAELIRRIKEVPGVYDVSLSVPTANVVSAANVKIMPGAIAVS